MAVPYSVGDIVQQSSPTSGYRFIKVTKREKDIKNGRAGFDGLHCDREGNIIQGRFGPHVWGYDDQIRKVV